MRRVGQQNAPVRAVVFDLFDTLVDLHSEGFAPIAFGDGWLAGTARDLYETFAAEVTGVTFETFAEAMQTVDGEFRRSRYAKGLELPTAERFGALIDRVGGGASLVERLVAVHMGALHGQVRNLDHHEDILERLGERVSLALCSNFSHSETALRVLDEAGLRAHLDVITVSDVQGFRKPRPEIFLETLDGLGFAPEEVLHVGDNLVADVGGAGALGIRTVWLTRRVKDPQATQARYDGPAADYVIEDLAQLPAIVDRLKG